MKFQITKDNKWIQIIEATKFEFDQLNSSFTKEVEGAKFNPLVKRGMWDGKIKFVQHNSFLPVGLYNEVLKWGQRFGIETLIYGLDIFRIYINKEEFIEYFENFFKDKEMKPYPYQYECAYNILTHRMSTSELATSAGKTIIMFMTCVWLKEKLGIDRILIVVPKTMLVNQGIKDFQSYNEWNLHTYTAKAITEGSKEPVNGINFIFGTYQTLIKREKELFENINGIIIDECHGTKAKTVKTILNLATNVKIKYGLTGTLYKGSTALDYEIQSYLGPMIQQISPKFLQDNGYATKIKVKMIYLDYLEEGDKKNLSSLKTKPSNIEEEFQVNDELSGNDLYNFERKIVIENPKRFKFVTETIARVSKNSLVLFSDVQNEYGKRVYDRIRELTTDKEAFYIDGGTKETNREWIKTQMEIGNNKILIASFGVLSTGISIKNIHNIFLIESYKSEVIIKQTIGRGMRLYKGKDFVYIIDFVDDFSFKKKKGIIFKHSEERKKIYLSDQYPIEEFKIKL